MFSFAQPLWLLLLTYLPLLWLYLRCFHSKLYLPSSSTSPFGRANPVRVAGLPMHLAGAFWQCWCA